MHDEPERQHDPPPRGDLPPPSRRSLGIPTLAGVVGIAFVVGCAAYWGVRHWRSAVIVPVVAPPAPVPEDPRLSYSGPFQNIHPDVPYVGDAKCAQCHSDIATAYREHPMGRSLLPIPQIEGRLRHDREAHDPFDALDTQFHTDSQGDRLVFLQSARDEKGAGIYELTTSVDFALGSGTRGYSFLTNRDGYLCQAPVSWFSQKQIWDVSPGFNSEWRAGRPVSAECLYCHANRVRCLEGYVNRYQEPIFDGYTIGCERCHGPGAAHVAYRGGKDQKADPDYTIVNPRHLGPELRASVCEQCHVTGEARVVPRGRDLQDFRPGLPFEAFRTVLVLDAETSVGRKAVGHVEQMYQSKCFSKSVEKPADGTLKLGCTSCHDPHRHESAAQRAAHYRERCLKCHESGTPCNEPELKRQQVNGNSCIDCHMPRYPSQDIGHNASTDHRIVRKHELREQGYGNLKDEPSFVVLHGKRPESEDPDYQRNLGIGLAHVLVRYRHQGSRPPVRLSRRALELLETAVRNDATDQLAWEAKGQVLSLLDRPSEALDAYESALARNPRREASLREAATAARAAQKLDKALEYGRGAVAENPWQAGYRARLTALLVQRQSWTEALEHAEAWVRLDPANIDARVHLVSCLANTGAMARGREEFTKIERLNPRTLPDLQARFTVELRDR